MLKQSSSGAALIVLLFFVSFQSWRTRWRLRWTRSKRRSRANVSYSENNSTANRKVKEEPADNKEWPCYFRFCFCCDLSCYRPCSDLFPFSFFSLSPSLSLSLSLFLFLFLFLFLSFSLSLSICLSLFLQTTVTIFSSNPQWSNDELNYANQKKKIRKEDKKQKQKKKKKMMMMKILLLLIDGTLFIQLFRWMMMMMMNNIFCFVFVGPRLGLTCFNILLFHSLRSLIIDIYLYYIRLIRSWFHFPVYVFLNRLGWNFNDPIAFRVVSKKMTEELCLLRTQWMDRGQHL